MGTFSNDPHGRAVSTNGFLPPVLTDDPVAAQGRLLVRVGQLGDRGVAEVKTRKHGVLAVGVTPTGVAFAVSNLCRHQLAKLGRGRVTDDGCLQCPWHRAEYDVTEGTMVAGPKGKLFGFKPYSALIKTFGRQARLRTFPVEVVDGAIWLRD